MKGRTCSGAGGKGGLDDTGTEQTAARIGRIWEPAKRVMTHSLSPSHPSAAYQYKQLQEARPSISWELRCGIVPTEAAAWPVAQHAGAGSGGLRRKHLADGGVEGGEIDGFGEVCRKASVVASGDVRFHAKPSQRDRPAFVLAPHLPHQVQSAAVGQAK